MEQLLVNRLTVSCRNSSKPPSTDQNSSRDQKPKDGNAKPGGQQGKLPDFILCFALGG